MSDQPIRVLIVDDHPLFRRGLRTSLADVSDVEVVGEASDGEQAVRVALELQPDVVLMDVQMPGVSGVEATRRVLAEAPAIGVLMLTMFEDDGSVLAAMRAGARGYVLKGAGQEDVLRAIRSVAAGDAVFGAAVATRLLDHFSSPQDKAFPDLTDREREILELIAAGRSNQWIATELAVSVKTVRNHVSNVFAKLAVAGRAAAIVKARNAGMGR